jgi:hypothetical protein
MSRKFAVAVAATLVNIHANAWAADPAPVPYPAGYRDWHHVKSMVIQQGHALYQSFGGIHHIYANKAAIEGYRKGRFPDGAVIVFDLIDAKNADNTVTEGDRKVVGVMRKDSKQYKDTGGWGYEGFARDSNTERAVGKNAASACHRCHVSQKDRDFVFSSLRK